MSLAGGGREGGREHSPGKQKLEFYSRRMILRFIWQIKKKVKTVCGERKMDPETGKDI